MVFKELEFRIAGQPVARNYRAGDRLKRKRAFYMLAYNAGDKVLKEALKDKSNDQHSKN